MLKTKWLNLQLFAGEGASGSAGTGEGTGGAATGENATVDAEQRLRELGVPEDKIRKRASKVASKAPTQTAKAEETNVQSAPANDNPS